MDASVYAEDMCNELVSISSSLENPGVILQGVDKMQRPFLDVLIECELKQVNKSHRKIFRAVVILQILLSGIRTN